VTAPSLGNSATEKLYAKQLEDLERKHRENEQLDQSAQRLRPTLDGQGSSKRHWTVGGVGASRRGHQGASSKDREREEAQRVPREGVGSGSRAGQADEGDPGQAVPEGVSAEPGRPRGGARLDQVRAGSRHGRADRGGLDNPGSAAVPDAERDQTGRGERQAVQGEAHRGAHSRSGQRRGSRAV